MTTETKSATSPRMADGASMAENLDKLHQDYIDYNILNVEVLLALLDQITPVPQDKKDKEPPDDRKPAEHDLAPASSHTSGAKK